MNGRLCGALIWFDYYQHRHIKAPSILPRLSLNYYVHMYNNTAGINASFDAISNHRKLNSISSEAMGVI